MRVVVVDDDDVARSYLWARLGDLGIETVALDRADVDTIIGYQPDVVVLDVNLPGTNGLAVLSRLRRRLDGAIRVILFTAYPTIGALAEDADGCFDKWEGPKVVEQIAEWAGARGSD